LARIVGQAEPSFAGLVLPLKPKEKMMDENQEAKKSVEGENKSDGAYSATLPAGPKARSKVDDHEKTPGSGALPSEGTKDIDPGSE
jgi:hypothetical protein